MILNLSSEISAVLIKALYFSLFQLHLCNSHRIILIYSGLVATLFMPNRQFVVTSFGLDLSLSVVFNSIYCHFLKLLWFSKSPEYQIEAKASLNTLEHEFSTNYLYRLYILLGSMYEPRKTH